jgi:hypothetical protein
MEGSQRSRDRCRCPTPARRSIVGDDPFVGGGGVHYVTVTKPTDRCRWCRRPLDAGSRPGRPRLYCRQSCRQRDYEARRRAAELGLSESEVVLARGQLEALVDQLYVLEAAIEDVDGDLARASGPDDYRDALAWLLDAARPLVALARDHRPVSSQ